MRLKHAAAALLAWGCLWAVGYSPADYPMRVAVRAFGHTVSARSSGHSWVSRGVYRVRFFGSKATDTINESAMKRPGWHRLMALELGGWTVYRLARGFPFTTFDRFVTVGLAFALIWLLLPGFFGRGPAPCRAGAPRLPLTVLKAADIAGGAWVVLGPSMYSNAQAWVTCAVWFAVRWARYKGRVEFIQFRPPASEPPTLAIPPSEAAPVRQVPAPKPDPDSFLAVTTPEGWSRLPGIAVAVGVFILLAVNARNRLISVPVPGFRVFGLSLQAWSAVGWALLASAAVIKVREFLRAWRRSED